MIIKNALLVNETGNLEKRDVLISEEGKIERISESIETDHNEFDAKEMLLVPGLVDLHVHLREPGGEHKETIETGTKAAAKGGFTTIAAMPNTRPVPDQASTMTDLMKRIEKGSVRVLPYGSITVRQLGEELTNFEGLRASGAFALTDDGVGVQNANVMLEAMKRAASAGLSIVAHCEENTLINKGSVHEGKFSEQYDLNGIPSVCESVHIARDVLLAEAAGAHYHVCHISTKESVRTVRDAKRAGIHVTAEVTPHHLLLCEDDIPGLDTNYKMNPPLRSKEDQKALIEGLLDGTIDFIATDHAPHAEDEKATSMEKAPFGIVGLETAFPLLYTNFVKKGTFTLKQLVDWLTIKPAGAFGLPHGTLKEGVAADITLIDLNKEEHIDPDTFVSKGRNTPFKGWKCKGWAAMTLVNGKKVFEKGSDHE
ncbi:dihydroorotase [Alkalihalobacillus sp. CinArs1]|uniref:dihydroorotase n=1 Tax=Alkalihalobacillus sp. CinArs1 TaxID=2995314 RepID=UPI0022DD3656|nr:dihydroorotase [Alkalihalobacillus sp. CinArs1]